MNEFTTKMKLPILPCAEKLELRTTSTSHTTKHISTDIPSTSIRVNWIKSSQYNTDNNPEKNKKDTSRQDEQCELQYWMRYSVA